MLVGEQFEGPNAIGILDLDKIGCLKEIAVLRVGFLDLLGAVQALGDLGERLVEG